jgi:hypothetical protein
MLGLSAKRARRRGSCSPSCKRRDDAATLSGDASHGEGRTLERGRSAAAGSAGRLVVVVIIIFVIDIGVVVVVNPVPHKR